MSFQSTKRRHRGPFMWWRRPRPVARPAGTAYAETLLTPTLLTPTVTTLGGSRIGHYHVAALKRWDVVRIMHSGLAAHVALTGIVIDITGIVLPVVVQLPGGAVVYAEPADLELIERPDAMTQEIDVVLAGERAW